MITKYQLAKGVLEMTGKERKKYLQIILASRLIKPKNILVKEKGDYLQLLKKTNLLVSSIKRDERESKEYQINKYTLF